MSSISLHKPTKKKKIKGVKYFKSDVLNLKKLRKILSTKYDYVVNLGGYINHSFFNNGGRKIIRQHFET